VGLIDSTVTIQGRLVTLRPVSREDYPTLFRWRSSFDGAHLSFKRRIATFEEFVRELEAMLPNSVLLLVRRAKMGDAIGYALGYNIDQWDGCMSVGMYIEPRLQVRGYGGEAALRYVDFLFRNFPLRRITSEIYEFATATLGIVRAMGAEEAGFIPEHFWHEDRYWGVHFMVLTRENWNQYRERFADVVDVQWRYGQLSVDTRDGRVSAHVGGGE
jgi:RimJ/RimL family protein N-acetyltransferase